ncbi:hypothetical protein Y1Q_0012462 [Alligator mississippiensis]|uniref:Uncharacterized protein n=1 Tax=Alligator mississippiensis TaxID=8496 RepID=A0A151M7S1_ALLMI|nr:hypothetical protein Y1Q_0012462 [Alligator mississippiensis]
MAEVLFPLPSVAVAVTDFCSLSGSIALDLLTAPWVPAHPSRDTFGTVSQRSAREQTRPEMPVTDLAVLGNLQQPQKTLGHSGSLKASLKQDGQDREYYTYMKLEETERNVKYRTLL